MMRFLIAAVLVLSCSLCLAEDFPRNTNEIRSLTAEQAAELVAKYKGSLLSLTCLTSIDKDVLNVLNSNPEIELEKYRDKKT